MSSPWPFENSPNVAVFTTRAVVKGGQPILYVSHDDEDGAWQFHTGQVAHMADAMLVALQDVFKLDPSIGELADLDYGWIATREMAASPWIRTPRP